MPQERPQRLGLVESCQGDGGGGLTAGESVWTFAPDVAWRVGAYELVARGTLEDPAGNRLGSRFETSIDSPAGPATDAVVPFTVGPRRTSRPFKG